MLRGLTLANIGGSSPSRPIANRIRVWPYMTTSVTEKIEITAPAARIVLAQVWPCRMFSRITESPASAWSSPPKASASWVPRPANATRM
jgi:hypothetical protein